jgi:GR25 family glycosyltransferase involved in LPS biosynthesis
MDKTSIFYINLANRYDRRDHIEKELEKVSKIRHQRIEAVHVPTNGAYGCILSHILALQTFLANELLDTCIILEDDFTFFDADPYVRLHNLFTSDFDWDIVSLAYNPSGIVEPCNMVGFKKVIRIGTTSGYIVRRRFAEKLLQNFQEAKVLMETRGRCYESCLDVHWKVLQPISKWFAFEPRLGFQCESHSDIEGKVVNYKC